MFSENCRQVKGEEDQKPKLWETSFIWSLSMIKFDSLKVMEDAPWYLIKCCQKNLKKYEFVENTMFYHQNFYETASSIFQVNST